MGGSGWNIEVSIEKKTKTFCIIFSVGMYIDYIIYFLSLCSLQMAKIYSDQIKAEILLKCFSNLSS